MPDKIDEKPPAANSGKTMPCGRRWQKGQSGNPNGRPKKLPITDALREELLKRGKYNVIKETLIARALIEKAIAGDMEAIREIADRVEGKPRQRIEQSGPDGGPIPLDLPQTREGLEHFIADMLSGAQHDGK